MISRDVDLIAEAYLSALQKQTTPDVPEPAMDSVAEVNPEVTDTSENAAVVNVPPGPEAAPVTATAVIAGGDHCCSDDENEEQWMARSNLFSLYSNAKKIHNFMQSGIMLEPWAQQKIAVAADNLQSIMKAVDYEAAEKGAQI